MDSNSLDSSDTLTADVPPRGNWAMPGPHGLKQENNRARILRLLRRHGPMARVDLGKRTGLSAAAVSTITSDLIAGGILAESAGEAVTGNARGRPPVNLEFDAGHARVAAASLRMDVIDAVIADFKGDLLAREMIPCTTRELSGDQVTALCAEAIRKVMTQVPGPAPSALGLAVQGIVDPTAGRQIWSPILAIRDTDLVTPLAKDLGIPVVMENDAAATALAVASRDDRLQHGLVAVLMVGHGVGMGLLVDGGPFPGTHGFSSEIGHVRRQPAGAQCRCGQRGCIEASLADYALYRDARSIANLPITNHQQPTEQQMKDLVRRAEGGEVALQRLFDEAGVSMADAVRVVASVLSPHRIAIAGSGMRGFHLMRQRFEAVVRESLTPSLDPASDIVIDLGGTELIVMGMVQLALQRLDACIGTIA